MPLYRFGNKSSKVTGGVYKRSNVVTKKRTTTASAMPTSSGPSRSSGNQVDRYNPAYDRLDEGSVIEDWIPRDLPGINKMMRQIYYRDGIAGPAVDLIASLPWSGFDITGIEDPGIRRFYEEAAQVFGPNAEDMRDIATEYLTLGRFAASMLYNEAKGYWDDYMPIDSDFLTITPIPVRGTDPKLDMTLSPALRQFVESSDYRDRTALFNLPEHLQAKLRTGRDIALDPLATLWCARRTSPYDYVGTSIFTRIIPFWAVEKALLNATVVAARRRAGNILHVTAGLDDRWEPDIEELSDIAGLFMQADEDPTGAVVVTRTGVESQEIRQGGNLWKISDEWSFLSEGKMRALGVSEALLSGDTNYANMEQARSIFSEQLRQLRMFLTNEVYTKRFRILARAHGFVKRSQAEINHRIRISPNTHQPPRPHSPGEKSAPTKNMEDLTIQDIPQEDALALPDQDLIVPSMYWHKTLRPEADDHGLDMLDRIKQLGFPVTMQMIASRAGQDLDQVLSDLDDDIETREKILKWQKKTSESSDEDFGFASLADPHIRPGKSPLWDPQKRFMGLSWSEAVRCIADFYSEGGKELFRDPVEITARLGSYFENSSSKASAMAYLLMRAGFCYPKSLPISSSYLDEISTIISNRKDMPKKEVAKEITAFARLTDDTALSGIGEGGSFQKDINIRRAAERTIKSNDTTLLSGVDKT